MATKASSKKPVTKTAVKKAETSTEAKSESKKATNLPKELFGGDVNKPLLAQAVRVYLANQREGSAKTKTRGEVEGSTRKIFRQKGTGRARHGGIRAPIFVGGGIVFGPVPRDFRLTMNKKMKRAALVSSLSARKSSVLVVDDLVLNEPKTKTVAALFDGMSITGSILFVLPEKSDIVMKATRNIPFVHAIHARDIHPYAILTNKHIVFTKAALEESKTYFTK